MKNLISAFLFITLAIISCKKTQDNTAIAANGTIVKQTIDGCVWLIKLDNNKILEPMNLSSFNTVNVKDGQRVYLTYKIYNGFSTCMMGDMVTLIKISNQ